MASRGTPPKAALVTRKPYRHHDHRHGSVDVAQHGVAVQAGEWLGEVEAREAVGVRGHLQREHHGELPRLHALDLRHVGDVGAKPLVEHQREVDQVAPRHVLAHVRLREVQRRVGAAHVGVGVQQQSQPEVTLVPLLGDALPLAHMIDGGVVGRDRREAPTADAAHLLCREVVVVEDVATQVGGGAWSDAIRQLAAHIRNVRGAIVRVRALGHDVVVQRVERDGARVLRRLAPAREEVVLLEAATELHAEAGGGAVTYGLTGAADSGEGEPPLDQVDPLGLQRHGRLDPAHAHPWLAAAGDEARVELEARHRVAERHARVPLSRARTQARPRQRVEQRHQPAGVALSPIVRVARVAAHLVARPGDEPQRHARVVGTQAQVVVQVLLVGDGHHGVVAEALEQAVHTDATRVLPARVDHRVWVGRQDPRPESDERRVHSSNFAEDGGGYRECRASAVRLLTVPLLRGERVRRTKGDRRDRAHEAPAAEQPQRSLATLGGLEPAVEVGRVERARVVAAPADHRLVDRVEDAQRARMILARAQLSIHEAVGRQRATRRVLTRRVLGFARPPPPPRLPPRVGLPRAIVAVALQARVGVDGARVVHAEGHPDVPVARLLPRLDTRRRVGVECEEQPGRRDAVIHLIDRPGIAAHVRLVDVVEALARRVAAVRVGKGAEDAVLGCDAGDAGGVGPARLDAVHVELGVAEVLVHARVVLGVPRLALALHDRLQPRDVGDGGVQRRGPDGRRVGESADEGVQQQPRRQRRGAVVVEAAVAAKARRVAPRAPRALLRILVEPEVVRAERDLELVIQQPPPRRSPHAHHRPATRRRRCHRRALRRVCSSSRPPRRRLAPRATLRIAPCITPRDGVPPVPITCVVPPRVPVLEELVRRASSLRQPPRCRTRTSRTRTRRTRCIRTHTHRRLLLLSFLTLLLCHFHAAHGLHGELVVDVTLERAPHAAFSLLQRAVGRLEARLGAHVDRVSVAEVGQARGVRPGHHACRAAEVAQLVEGGVERKVEDVTRVEAAAEHVV
eukprot:scaffold38137_cov67-Phaeocystis_antarctica.AAC.3